MLLESISVGGVVVFVSSVLSKWCDLYTRTLQIYFLINGAIASMPSK